MRDLEAVLRAGIYDLRAERLRALPELACMGASSDAPASAQAIRERLLGLIDAIGPGSMQSFALALFGATPDTRSRELQGRRELAGQVVRPDRPISAEGVRKRPFGREWKLLRYLAEEIAALDGSSGGISEQQELSRRLLGLDGAEKIRGFWNLRRRATVDIVCSEILEDERPYFADPSDRNYLRYAKFADLDGLIYARTRLAQLFPSVVVRDFTPSEHYDTNAQSLIVIGGPAWNATFREFQSHLPCGFEPHPLGEDDPLVFTAFPERRFGPMWTPSGTLRADVALFARLTLDDGPLVYLLGGCLTHGVLGAAKAFLDASTAPGNIDFVTHYTAGADFILACEAHRTGGLLEAPRLTATDPLALLVRDEHGGPFRPAIHPPIATAR